MAPGKDGTWHVVDSVFTAVNDGFLPIDVAVDKSGTLSKVSYYEITLPAGDPSAPFMFAVPVPTGHYSVSGFRYIGGFGRTPGVNFQTQVAP